MIFVIIASSVMLGRLKFLAKILFNLISYRGEWFSQEDDEWWAMVALIRPSSCIIPQIDISIYMHENFYYFHILCSHAPYRPCRHLCFPRRHFIATKIPSLKKWNMITCILRAYILALLRRNYIRYTYGLNALRATLRTILSPYLRIALPPANLLYICHHLYQPASNYL